MSAIHATCVVVGEAAVLIRGPSGSGKSTLAALLLDGATVRGRFARLVSDDRVRIEARHGRLLARVVPAIAGRMEARGVGLLAVPHEPAAVVRLLVDCGDRDQPRWPTDEAATLDGVVLPRIAGRATPHFAHLLLRHLLGEASADHAEPSPDGDGVLPRATDA